MLARDQILNLILDPVLLVRGDSSLDPVLLVRGEQDPVMNLFIVHENRRIRISFRI